MRPAHRLKLLTLLLIAFPLARYASAQDRFPGAEWQHAAAGQSGWTEAGIASIQDAARALNTTALMVIHHGLVVADSGDTVKRTALASVRKSFLSALIGIAVAEKKISLDSTLAQLGIDDNPPSLSDTEKQATVRMLLQARSGVYHPALYETASMAAGRPMRFGHVPGTFWYYNNWDFNALGTIYEQATGTGIYDALDKLIARPIGMQDYRPSDGEYFSGAASIHRAYPIRMSARDLARFALLYLHEGSWSGHEVVPAAWVRESTRPYSSTGFGAGYAYLWWTAAPADPSAPGGLGLPKGTFFAEGAGGQYAWVIPARDLVVVSRVDWDRNLPEPRLSRVVDMVRLILHTGGLGP